MDTSSLLYPQALRGYQNIFCIAMAFDFGSAFNCFYHDYGFFTCNDTHTFSMGIAGVANQKISGSQIAEAGEVL
jgi:hypothetical protein